MLDKINAWFETTDWFGRPGPYNENIEYTIFYIAYIILGILLITFLTIKHDDKKTKTALIVFWALNVVLDIFKTIGLLSDGKLNVDSDLLLYICSLFLYAMPFAIWGKGKVKAFGCTFVCTIGLFGGMMNFIMSAIDPTVSDTYYYSLFSFYGPHTALYHLNLLLVPLIILITGYYKLTFKDFPWAFLGFIIMTIPALIVNAVWETDWMYLNNGSTTYLDFVVSISDATGWFFTVIVYFFYAFLQALWSGIIVGITALINLIKKRFSKKVTL
ncbi:MAG: YwaF family protein [Clostridia bacterium]|nr:YwaF family protein [Clostridia bacterium]